MTARVVMQYVRTKEDAGLSRKSIRKHLVILNGVFTEAMREKRSALRMKSLNGETRPWTIFCSTAFPRQAICSGI